MTRPANDPRLDIFDSIDQALEYFDQRLDVAADCPDGTTPNEEMRHHTALTSARASLAQLLGVPSRNPAPHHRLPPPPIPPLDDPLRRNPGYWEALSHRYSSRIAMFLPVLGSFAIYNAARNPTAFLPQTATLAEAFAANIQPEPQVERRMGRMISGPTPPDLDELAEGFDL